MPIAELGYRHWKGALSAPWLRWLAITNTGVRLAFKSALLRRLLFMSWLPVLVFAGVFFIVGLLTDQSWRDNGVVGMVRRTLGTSMVLALRDDPQSVRLAIWSLIFFFHSFYQIFLCMLITAIVGPPLISVDVQSKAFLVYFSRPITRFEYLLGKAAVLLIFLFAAGLLPALCIYAVSVLFSPGIEVIFQTGITVPRIFLASLAIGVPATTVMLFYSSLTGSRRYASIGWMSTWLLGEFGYMVMSSNFEGAGWTFLLSIRKTISVAVQSIFDVEGSLKQFWGADRIYESLGSSYSSTLAFGWLVGVTLVCLIVIYRRISAPMRI